MASKHGFKYLDVYADRHGKQRVYFKRRGFRMALPPNIGSTAFLTKYYSALEKSGLPAHQRQRITVQRRTDATASRKGHPQLGVYLLLLDGEIVYVGSSLKMPERAKEHRSAGRAFDQVFYIGTAAGERSELERLLIDVIRPRGNRIIAKPKRRQTEDGTAISSDRDPLLLTC